MTYRNAVDKHAKWIEETQELLTPKKARGIKDSSLQTFEQKGLTIRTERLSDKDYCRFHVSIPIPHIEKYVSLEYPISDKNSINRSSIDTKVQEYAKTLFETLLVKKVSIQPFDFTIKKSGATDWNDIDSKICQVIASFYPNIERMEQTLATTTVPE